MEHMTDSISRTGFRESNDEALFVHQQPFEALGSKYEAIKELWERKH